MTPQPLSPLDALAGPLRTLLAGQGDFFALLQRRLADALPAPFNQHAADALYLDQQPLPQAIARAIGGQALTASTGQYLAAEAVLPLPEEALRATQRFAEQFSADAQQLWLDALTAFWEYPQGSTGTPRVALAAWLGEQWHAQVALREKDQTLPAEHLALAQPGEASTATWRALLALATPSGEQFVPGACVLAARDPLEHPAEPVLLSTLAWGLEGFDNWAALYQEVAERLEDDIQGPALLAAQDPAGANAALASRALTARLFTGPVFEQLAANLIARQRRAASQAWEQAVPLLAEGEFFAANDVLKAGLALAPLLLTDAINRSHYVALLLKGMPAWLKALSEAEMLALNQSKNRLWVATLASQARGMLTLAQFHSPHTLHAYARRTLIEGLRPLGVSLPPERILITTVSARAVGPLVPPLNPAETGFGAGNTLPPGGTVELVPHTVTLINLALHNVSPLDFNYLLTATVRDDQGQAIAGLDAYKVRRLVRQANVGGRYQAYLAQQLRGGPHAGWRRQAHRALLCSKMHYEGLKAAYRGHLGEARTLHPWIEALTLSGDTLAAPSGAVHSWQLMLRQTPVVGVYLFGAAPGEQAEPVLLYAPGNPNGQHWSLFASRQALARDWLSQAPVRQYLLRRTALAEHAALRPLLGSQAITNLIHEQPIRGDFFANAYRDETRLMMANADALSSSNAEIDRNALADLTLTLIEFMSMVLPAKATAVLSVSRAIWAGVQVFHELESEAADYPIGAFVDLTTHVLEATVALSTSPVVSKVIRRLSFRGSLPIPVQYAAPHAGQYLRYTLESEAPSQVIEAQPTVGGHSEYYIQDATGRRYEVLYDGEHWRLVDGRKPDALYKPVIKQLASGEWVMVDQAFWRGPLPDVAGLLRRVAQPAEAALADGEVGNHEGREYLRLGEQMVPVRPSLLAGRYTVVVAPEQRSEAPLTLKLRRNPEGPGWQGKARQNAMASPWVGV
ncbi:hypothetical protein [Pseudomonas sp. NPDC007930]|uniref:hypothetical protein n=1 Tax=Pseudomonas sp. NPDC007930 TaxID=3364417 RepID=UPI0036E09132